MSGEPRRSRTLRTLRRLGVLTLGMAAVLLLPPPAWGGIGWDAAQVAGWWALAAALLLYVYPLRAARAPRAPAAEPTPTLSLDHHELLGYAVLLLTALHLGIFLWREPQVWVWFLPSGPIYLLAGLGALVLLAALTVSGVWVRVRLRERRAPGRALGLVHGVGAAAVLALLAAHALGSGQYADRLPKAMSVGVELALVSAWCFWRQPGLRLRPSGLALAFAASILAGLVVALPASPARVVLHAPVVGNAPALPRRFPHPAHVTVNCVACHHNFIDRTGTGSCIDCHRSARADLPQSSQATFHAFCRDCHAERAIAHARHGPTRTCSGCHAPE